MSTDNAPLTSADPDATPLDLQVDAMTTTLERQAAALEAQAAALRSKATRLFLASEDAKRGVTEPPEAGAPDSDFVDTGELPGDPDALEAYADDLINQADRLRGDARARAEEADPDAEKHRVADKIRRQAWALYGQLILTGLIAVPDLDRVGAAETARIASDIHVTVMSLDLILARLDQETLE